MAQQLSAVLGCNNHFEVPTETSNCDGLPSQTPNLQARIVDEEHSDAARVPSHAVQRGAGSPSKLGLCNLMCTVRSKDPSCGGSVRGMPETQSLRLRADLGITGGRRRARRETLCKGPSSHELSERRLLGQRSRVLPGFHLNFRPPPAMYFGHFSSSRIPMQVAHLAVDSQRPLWVLGFWGCLFGVSSFQGSY